MKKLGVFLLVAMMLASLFVMNVSAVDEFNIPKAAAAPTIDGVYNADEWANALVVEMDPAKLDWKAADNKATEISNYYFMWDETALYFCGVVNDTTVSSIVPAFGTALNSGDGVQLAIYGMDSQGGNTNGVDLMFFSIHPKTSTGAPDVHEHFNFISQLKDALVASTFSNDSAYTIECALPWTLFADAYDNNFCNLIEGKTGQQFLMDTIIMDASSAQGLGCYGGWFAPTGSNVFTLTADVAGKVEAPVEDTTAAPPAETAADAPVEVPSAQTSDTVLISAAVMTVLCAGAVVLLKKKNG